MAAEYNPLGGFGLALAALKNGGAIAREGWNGNTEPGKMWVQVQTPDAHSKMSLPYIFMCTADGDLVPWVASHTDLLATDWQLIDFDV
jgi:hypothetical protein